MYTISFFCPCLIDITSHFPPSPHFSQTTPEHTCEDLYQAWCDCIEMPEEGVDCNDCKKLDETIPGIFSPEVCDIDEYVEWCEVSDECCDQTLPTRNLAGSSRQLGNVSPNLCDSEFQAFKDCKACVGPPTRAPPTGSPPSPRPPTLAPTPVPIPTRRKLTNQMESRAYTRGGVNLGQTNESLESSRFWKW